MKSCVFCDVELVKSNRSKEHVIPCWLQKARGISDEFLSAGFGDASKITVQRRMEMNSFLAGNVCETCNSGWMSDLENDTRNILVQLLDRKLALEELNEPLLLRLAKWTVKTAIACNSALPKEPNIDSRFIRQFDFGRNLTLGTCGVFAGFLNIPNRFGYIQTTADNPMILGSEPSELRIAIYLDGLFLITAIVVAEGLGYTFELLEGIHSSIWPGRGHEFRKDVDPLRLTGAEADLKIVTDSLRVRYRFNFS